MNFKFYLPRIVNTATPSYNDRIILGFITRTWWWCGFKSVVRLQVEIGVGNGLMKRRPIYGGWESTLPAIGMSGLHI